MSQSFDHYYEQACEFTIPIKLNIPVFLEPYTFIKPTPCIKQTLPVHLEPAIFVEAEVQATPPVCLPQYDYTTKELAAQELNE
jgi:hypothetical protein